MNGVVACFGGKIGSGKTSVTRALAHGLQWRRIGIGDYLRRQFARRGEGAATRRDLQDLGQRLAGRPALLCRAVLDWGSFSPGEDLLVDGLRHVSVYRVLREVVRPSRTYLFYLRASEGVRRFRVAGIGGTTSVAESHPVEAETGAKLLTVADAVIDADQPVREVVLRCIEKLGTYGVDAKVIAAARTEVERG